MSDIIGCLPRSFSSTSAFVLQPVFVFLPAGSISSSKSTSPSCLGEFMLNSCPAWAHMRSWSVFYARHHAFAVGREGLAVHEEAGALHIRQHAAERELYAVVELMRAALRELRVEDGIEPPDGLGGRQLAVQMAEREAVERICVLGGVEDIGGKLGVKDEAGGSTFAPRARDMKSFTPWPAFFTSGAKTASTTASHSPPQPSCEQEKTASPSHSVSELRSAPGSTAIYSAAFTRPIIPAGLSSSSGRRSGAGSLKPSREVCSSGVRPIFQ